MTKPFKTQVRGSRGSRLRGDEADLFGGDVWTARSALERGLIDGIGDLRTIMRGRFGDKVRFVPVTPRRNWLRRRLGLEVPESWLEGVLSAVEERKLWGRYGL